MRRARPRTFVLFRSGCFGCQKVSVALDDTLTLTELALLDDLWRFITTLNRVDRRCVGSKDRQRRRADIRTVRIFPQANPKSTQSLPKVDPKSTQSQAQVQAQVKP
jgi:hypothetical protein